MAVATSNRRWFWYVLISIGVVVVSMEMGFHSYNPLSGNYYPWFQAAGLTVILFGYLLKWGWHYRKLQKFWKLYILLLAVHCGVLVICTPKIDPS